MRSLFFFFNDTATTEIYTLSLHDALPISLEPRGLRVESARHGARVPRVVVALGVGTGDGRGAGRGRAHQARRRNGGGGRQTARGSLGPARPAPLARGAAPEAQGRREVVPPLTRRRPPSSSSPRSRTCPGCPCRSARPSRTAARPTWSPPARCPRGGETPSARCRRSR